MRALPFSKALNQSDILLGLDGASDLVRAEEVLERVGHAECIPHRKHPAAKARCRDFLNKGASLRDPNAVTSVSNPVSFEVTPQCSA